MKLLLICLALISTLNNATAWAQSHHIPSHEDDHGPDIPKVGSSLFDKIYSTENSNGESVYNVPYPLTDLMNVLDQRQMVHVLFPLSRSLQRPVDLSYNPLTNPRIVFSLKQDENSIIRGKLFLGYVKARDQLEVISYNDEAGRFEFQIITDYSHDPKVYYVDRGKCLTCHQGQAPIFSPPSWQDSALGVSGHLMTKASGFDTNNFQTRTQVAKKLFGPLISRDDVAMFDSLVRESNQVTLDERVWVHGCGEDRRCRLGLLLNTVARNSYPAREHIDYARQILQMSPLREQKVYSSFLSSSSFGTFQIVKEYGVDRAAKEPNILLQIISLLYNLGPEDNPATARPLPLKRWDFITPLASFLISDLHTLRENIPDPNAVANHLIQLYESKDSIFEKDSLNKMQVMSKILEKVNPQKSLQYQHWLDKPTPQKVLFEKPLPPVFQQRALNLYSRHCSKCHASGFEFPPQFLLGNEDRVIQQMTDLKEKLQFKLEHNLMPPNAEARRIMHISGDYQRMLEYVREL